MNTKLLDKLMKNTKIKIASTVDKSMFFDEPQIATPIHLLNIALSGSLFGGYKSGLFGLAGESKSFKSMFGLIMMKSYMDHYPESLALFYDTEFGASKAYFDSVGIDQSRVVHIPIKDVEELKFEMAAQLSELGKDDKVFVFIDSIGNIASKKELEDALERHGAQDMSRAKSLKSLWRIVNPYLKINKIPCWAIFHTYKEQGSMYPQDIVAGGTGGIYTADNIFVIGKNKNKDGKELMGYNFVIRMYKSRSVREGVALPITVNYGHSINPYTGLLDIAIESGHVIAPTQGFYSRVIVNKDTGEVLTDKKWRRADTETKEFWEPMFTQTDFPDWVEKNFKVGNNSILEKETLDEDMEDDE